MSPGNKTKIKSVELSPGFWPGSVQGNARSKARSVARGFHSLFHACPAFLSTDSSGLHPHFDHLSSCPGHVLKTSLASDELPPLYMYSDEAPFIEGGGGVSKCPEHGHRTSALSPAMLSSSRAGCSVLTSQTPCRQSRVCLVCGKTTFVKYSSTNCHKYLLIFHISYRPTFTNLTLKIRWPCHTDFQTFWF